MAKVNINKLATTKTASGGEIAGNQRGKGPNDSEVANKVGVKMNSKNKHTKEMSSTKPKRSSSAEVSDVKIGAKKPAVKTIIVKTENVSGDSGTKKATTRKAVKSDVKKPKTESGLVVREKQIDPELALMASRSAAAEHAGPDVTRMRGNGKSMSGMVANRPGSRRRVNTAYSINAQRDKVRAEIVKKKEAEEAESRFSKLKSTLIGVGVALVVAVIGFAGIAIFGNNKKMCAVNFESNGGSKVAGTEIVCGRTVKEPDSPTKEGFSFEGWILEGDPFDFSTGIYKNATLVAKWKANSGTEIVTVRFDSDGGTKVDDIEVAKGKTLTRPTAPTKVGYVFDDWYLGDKVYNFATPVNENITLKAKWERRQTTTNNSGNSNNNTAKPNNRVTSLTAGDATVQAGKNVQIAVTVVPSSAEYQFSVSSSDAEVAECNITGTNITCVGKKPGTVTVTIRDNLSGNRDDFTVTVSEHEHVFEGGKCTICGAVDPSHTHNYENGKCTICGEEHKHNFGEDGNSKTCSGCGMPNPNYQEPTPEPEPEPEPPVHEHVFDESGKCSCGKTREEVEGGGDSGGDGDETGGDAA